MHIDSQDSERLDRAAQKAREFVPEHVASHAGERVELYKLRGRIGEELAQEEINGANLNDVTGKSNFANYDVVSSDYISSVKVKGLTEQGEPRYGDYNKYFKDIVNPNSAANQQAASDMLQALGNNPEMAQYLPTEIAEAQTQEEMTHAMADKGILQITHDQVDSTRNGIHKRIIKSPEDYGLSDSQNSAELEGSAKQLVDKHIQPIAEGQFSSHEIGKAAANVQQHSLGEEESENYYYGYSF